MLLTEQEVDALRKSLPAVCKHQDVIRAAESAVLEKLKAQEPVAWLITVEKQDGSKETYPAMGRLKDVKASCDFGEPIPLYEHPLPPDDVVRDAERYQFIRSQHQGVEKYKDAEWYDYTEPSPYGFTVFHSPNPDECSLEPVGSIAGELDAAIDAAMEKMK